MLLALVGSALEAARVPWLAPPAHRAAPGSPVAGGDAETGDPVHRLTALGAVQDERPKLALVSPRTPRRF
jgi:hypothetical protein